MTYAPRTGQSCLGSAANLPSKDTEVRKGTCFPSAHSGIQDTWTLIYLDLAGRSSSQLPTEPCGTVVCLHRDRSSPTSWGPAPEPPGPWSTIPAEVSHPPRPQVRQLLVSQVPQMLSKKPDKNASASYKIIFSCMVLSLTIRPVSSSKGMCVPLHTHPFSSSNS